MSALAEPLTWKFVFQHFNCITWCCRPSVSSSSQPRLYSSSGLCSVHQGAIKLKPHKTDGLCWNNLQTTRRTGNPQSHLNADLSVFYHFVEAAFLSFLSYFQWSFFFLRSPSDRVIKSHLCGTREIPQPWPGSRAHVSPNIDSTPSVYFEWSFFSVLLFLLYLSSGLAHWLWAAWSNVLMEVVSVKWACVCAPSPRPFCKLETYIWHMFRGSFSSADFQVGRESSCTDPEGTTWRTGAHMSVRTSRVRPTLLIRSCRNADACLS